MHCSYVGGGVDLPVGVTLAVGEVGGVLGVGEVVSSMEGVEAPLESPSLVSNLSFVEVDVLPATSISTIIL